MAGASAGPWVGVRVGVAVGVGVGAIPPQAGCALHGGSMMSMFPESQAKMQVTEQASPWFTGAAVTAAQHSLPHTQQTSTTHGGAIGQAPGWLPVEAPQPAPAQRVSQLM